MIDVVNVSGRKVGLGQPCFIIAEAGVNHNGSPEMARQLIDVAKAAGADAVKFQTYRTELDSTETAPKAAYQASSTGVEESSFDMLKRLELSPETFDELREYCLERSITFLSSAFEEESADLLEKLDVPAFKIPSGEVTDLPFLEHVARKGRPMIVSTGMCTLGEVEAAVGAIHGAGNEDLVLLHCVSAYPTPPADVNLRAIQTLATAFGVPVGFSDHTMGIGDRGGRGSAGRMCGREALHPGPHPARSRPSGIITAQRAGGACTEHPDRRDGFGPWTQGAHSVRSRNGRSVAEEHRGRAQHPSGDGGHEGVGRHEISRDRPAPGYARPDSRPNSGTGYSSGYPRRLGDAELNSNPRVIAVVTAGRADYNIYSSVLRRIQADPCLTLHLIVSGMHLSPEFGLTVKEVEAGGFEVGERVEMLLSSDSPEAIAKSYGSGDYWIRPVVRAIPAGHFAGVGGPFRNACGGTSCTAFQNPRWTY